MSAKNRSLTNIFHKKIVKELTTFLSEKKYSQHFILVDDHTVNDCLPILFRDIDSLKDAHILEIFSGESFKNIETVQQVWEQLTELNADRKSLLINLGGGMVCDLGGFTAATYKRGIDFIHIPTTLLSQVDAAYGGKQGIDFQHFKNQVGVFKNPEAIFVDTAFLKTLPAEQLTNGFAEVIKHGLLAGGKFWKKLHAMEDLKSVDWNDIVRESAAIKLSVVKKDPFEKDFRKILNFGHTIGHAIETNLLNREEEVLHGFCIAAGMIGELFLSHHLCGFPERKMLNINAYLRHHFPAVNMNPSFDDTVLNLMKQDKKNLDGRIQFALLQDTGEPIIGVLADEQMILQSLEYIRLFYQ